MTLVKWTPIRTRPATRIFNELDSWMDQVMNNRPVFTKNIDSWNPGFAVNDSEKEYIITADLPGMEKKEIDISVQENILKISGERKSEFENKSDEAENLLLRAIKIDGQNLNLYSVLAGFYSKHKAFKKVESLLQEAIAKNPTNELAYILLAGYYFSQKKYDQAEKLYQEAINTGNNAAKSYMVLANFYNRIKEVEKALDSYQKASALEPENLSIKSKISFAFFSSIFFSPAPLTKTLRWRSISSTFFLPMARRNKSAPPNE